MSAADLRAMHRKGDPLLLCNVWDAASAAIVAAAGFPALATTSAGLVEALGGQDTDSTAAAAVFGAIERITRAVDVPVTADIEAGYELSPTELADRLLDAGAVGCNLEDTNHHGIGDGKLVPAERQAERIAALRAAAGDALVINARTDAFARRIDRAVNESITRGRLYREAGADCVYPIAIADEADIEAVVDALGDIPVNALLWPGVPSIARLTALGVARISVGSGLFRRLQRTATRVTEALRAGDTGPLFESH